MVPSWARAAGFRRGASRKLFGALLAVMAAAGPVAANQLDKNDTRTLAGNRERTRFVIGLERAVDFQVSSLQNPNRVVVDLPDVKLQLPTISGDEAVGLVRSFRGGLASPGKTKVIIDVTDPVIVESSKLEVTRDKSHRLVLDIVPVDAKAAAPAKKAALANAVVANVGLSSVQPPLPKPAVRPSEVQAKSFKPVIVLDPGHGGHDSGAVRNGAVEKDVVLSFGLTLRDKLNATGRYKVLMTRDTDRFVDLDDRRAFGDDSKAGLFIAIHADYAGASARGATIYSLRDSVANDLKRSAKGEVVQKVLSEKEVRALPTTADAGDKAAVAGILSDLVDREVQVTKARTSLFSRAVIADMGATTTMMSNPDRTAAFRVLKTAKMPSVLIELAYVSNKQDAEALKSEQWRQKVSASIVQAIDNYFSHQIARLPM